MTPSLRQRLFAIILTPLVVISVAVGVWRIDDARQTAQELYDRNLLITALAVARDVALRDGDLILEETAALLRTTSGGPVRYHVYAPDGVFVTGYATPPVPVDPSLVPDDAVVYYNARYNGAPMRVLRLKDVTQIGGFAGTFTFTVWQDQAIRQQFVREQAARALAIMAALIGTVGFVVWFGVNYGLKPLLDLEDAISQRSPEDLSAIRRTVPGEVTGLVQRLNALFGQVNRTMEAQTEFAANAAHQLRNPIAGIRALGQAVQSAPTLEAAQARAGDLVEAAGEASELANKLLTLERLRSASTAGARETVDLSDLAATVVRQMTAQATARGVALAFTPAPDAIRLQADVVMLRQAVTNLIDNALTHAGPGMTRIEVTVRAARGMAELQVRDDGRGISADQIPTILARFGQAEAGPGSGLGLPIAQAVAERHGGGLQITPTDAGFEVGLRLPL